MRTGPAPARLQGEADRAAHHLALAHDLALQVIDPEERAMLEQDLDGIH